MTYNTHITDAHTGNPYFTIVFYFENSTHAVSFDDIDAFNEAVAKLAA